MLETFKRELWASVSPSQVIQDAIKEWVRSEILVQPSHAQSLHAYMHMIQGPWDNGIPQVRVEHNRYIFSLGMSEKKVLFTHLNAPWSLRHPASIHISQLSYFEKAEMFADTFRSHIDKYRVEGISNQSYFGRDLESLNVLKNFILPTTSTSAPPLRVCSVGCSIGIEPYSLLVLNWDNRQRLEISGCDIDLKSLKIARLGNYSLGRDNYGRRSESHDTFINMIPSAARLETVEFTPMKTQFIRSEDDEALLQMKPDVRAAVKFFKHDILERPLKQKQNIIFLRHVTLHFSEAGNLVCAQHCFDSLKEGGRLVLNRPQDDQESRQRAIVLKAFHSVGFVSEPLPGSKSSKEINDFLLKKP